MIFCEICFACVPQGNGENVLSCWQQRTEEPSVTVEVASELLAGNETLDTYFALQQKKVTNYRVCVMVTKWSK